MTFRLDRFIDACFWAAGDADPLERMRQLLQAAVDEPTIGTALPASQEDETLLHASADLTVTIHSVANPGRNYSRAIHVYLGPLTKIARSVWTADGLQERPFENTFYFAQARALSN